MFSLGLDISSLSTGAVVLSDTGELVFQGLWKPPPAFDYIDRGSWQAEQMLKLLDAHGAGIGQVCIEGYSLASVNGAEPLMTVGTVLRYFLRQSGFSWQIVAPSQLKKYAGAQLKQDLKLAVFKRWAFEHRSDDVVDAYVLARIGCAMHAPPADLIRPQQEVLEALLHPKPKKKKKEAA